MQGEEGKEKGWGGRTPHSTHCHCPPHTSPSPLGLLRPGSRMCAGPCTAQPGLGNRGSASAARLQGVPGRTGAGSGAVGRPGQGRSGSPTSPGLAACSVPPQRDRPPICKGGLGCHPSVTLLPRQSAGDTGRSACPRSSCCSPGAFSGPVNCVCLPAVQLRNVLPFALASAEVMFSAELSRALSGEGPRPEDPGDLAPPFWPGSSLLAPSRCQHSMSSSVWRGMGLDAALVQ